MRKIIFLGLVLISPSFLFGCTYRVADVSIISTRNVALDRQNLDRLPAKSNVTGLDSTWIILFFPIGVPQLEDAIDNALDKGGGDVLLDGVIYSGGWWFLVGQSTMTVKGTVVQTRGGFAR